MLSAYTKHISVCTHVYYYTFREFTIYKLTNDFASDTDDVLSLPVLDHVESLQGADDVFCCDARLVAAGIASILIHLSMQQQPVIL